MDIALPNFVEDYLISIRTEKMQNQGLILKNHLIKEQYFDSKSTPSNTIGAELDHISSLYDGRVELINNSFVVVEDTFSLDENKYCIDSNVIRCFDGEEVCEEINEEDQYVEITRRIASDTGDNFQGVLLIVFSIQDIYSLTAELTDMLHLAMLLIAIIVSAISFLYSIWIVHPLHLIEQTVVKVRQGDLKHRLPKSNYLEMRKTTDAFNDMMDRIESLDLSRQEFVSNVSHELKTPIAGIKVLADSLLTDDSYPPEVYREFLADIVTEIDRENDLILDLLELVRMDNSKAVLNIQRENINEAVEATMTRLRPIAALKNIELVFESFRPVIAEVDLTKLTIVVTNLVENAIKYNNQDGSVRVSLNADHRYCYLKVIDNGIGIPEDAQAKVFDRFYRVDKARSREEGGTGLGLAITQKIILMHHGEIRLYSKEGEGTTFTVRIPLNFSNII